MGTNTLIETNIYLQTLQGGANNGSAQELQNAIWNEAHAKFLTEIWTGKVANISQYKTVLVTYSCRYLAPGKMPTRFGWEIRLADVAIAGATTAVSHAIENQKSDFVMQ